MNKHEPYPGTLRAPSELLYLPSVFRGHYIERLREACARLIHGDRKLITTGKVTLTELRFRTANVLGRNVIIGHYSSNHVDNTKLYKVITVYQPQRHD